MPSARSNLRLRARFSRFAKKQSISRSRSHQSCFSGIFPRKTTRNLSTKPCGKSMGRVPTDGKNEHKANISPKNIREFGFLPVRPRKIANHSEVTRFHPCTKSARMLKSASNVLGPSHHVVSILSSMYRKRDDFKGAQVMRARHLFILLAFALFASPLAA